MTFLAPRTIAVNRPNVDATVGGQPYSGLSPASETQILSGIPARIQVDRQGPKPVAGLPGDTVRESLWKVIFKAANGQVQARDIIIDDLGNRYQVIAAYWGPLGTTCISELLET